MLEPLDPARSDACGTMVECAGLRLTRGQVWRLIHAEASRLRKVGVGTGDRVCIWSENCHVALTGFYAIAAVGGIAVPMNVRLSQYEKGVLLRNASPSSVLAHPAWIADAARSARAAGLHGMPILASLMEPRRLGGVQESDDSGPVAAIFYTGGSTGRPRGVMLTPDNIRMNARSLIVAADLDGTMTLLHAAPHYHLADAASLFATVEAGGSHLFDGPFSARSVVAVLNGGFDGWTTLVPTMLRRVIEHPSLTRRPSIARVVYGGSPTPPALIRRALSEWGPVLVQTYGLSEATSVVTALDVADHIAALNDRLDLLETCGQPVPGVSVRLSPVQHEVLVRGPNVMLGYWKDAEATHQAIGGGWLTTGDIGEWQEGGRLRIRGRLHEQINTGGEKVMPEEVERAVLLLDQVAEVAVFGVPDDEWGQRVHATVVLREPVTARELAVALEPHLARFCIPRIWTFYDGPLPRTSIGKLDKRRLKEDAVGVLSRRPR